MAIDAPISSRSEDQLGRKAFANAIASSLRALDASSGAVVGVFGAWGSGKTSFLNMIKEALSEEPEMVTVDFNPWLFSGTEQLMERFFGELAGQLRLYPGRFERVADEVIEYGTLVGPLQFIPVAGPWIGRTAAVAGVFKKLRAKRSLTNVVAEKAKLERSLASLTSPIFVFVDDMDRLEPRELRDIFQLVRLTASFPNVVYVLAFDRERVERVLQSEGFEGRSYLEKIVEIPYDVPPIPDATLTRILLEGLQEEIEDLETGPFNETLWVDVLHRGIRPLFSNLRDVKRYVAAVPTTLSLLRDEVALVDVLGLEALRLLSPDVHSSLWDASLGLTATSTHRIGDEGQAAVNQLIDAASENQAAPITDLIQLLFPAAERYLGGMNYGEEWPPRWRRERRVASADVLGYYLNHVLGPGVAPAKLVDAAFETLTDEEGLWRLFADVESDVLEDVFERLEAYENEFPQQAAEPASAVLLQTLSRLRESDRGMFDFGADLKAMRVVLRLLRRVDDSSVLTQIVERLLQRGLPWNAQLELVELVGHRPDVGHELLPRDAAERLYGEVCSGIRHSPPSKLASERHVLRLLAVAIEDQPSDRSDLDRSLQDDALFLALLRDSLGETKSQGMGRLAVTRTEKLSWDTLCDVLGGSSNVAMRIAALKEDPDALDERASQAVALARRYLNGWRPERRPPFFDRRIARYGPESFLYPSDISGVWPDLVLRAVSTYEPTDQPGKTIEIDPALRRSLEDALGDERLELLFSALTKRVGVESSPLSWEWNLDTYGTTSMAVMTAASGEVSGLLPVRLRGAVAVPDMHSPAIRVALDVYLNPSATDSDFQRLTLVELARLLTQCVPLASEKIPSKCLPELVGESIPPRESVELHVMAGRQDSTGEASRRTLSDFVELSPLGQGRSQPPTEGHYAVAGNVSLQGEHQPANLVSAALRRMAIDWGYLDPDPGIPAGESISTETQRS